MGRLGITEVH